jgi:putative membrane protein
MHAFDGYGGGWMMFWWIFIIPCLVVLVWWAMSVMRNSENRKPNDPLETLKDRYAKGEIDKKEFEEKRKSLLG